MTLPPPPIESFAITLQLSLSVTLNDGMLLSYLSAHFVLKFDRLRRVSFVSELHHLLFRTVCRVNET